MKCLSWWGEEEKEMDGDEKGVRAKKSFEGQNWLLLFLLLYVYIVLFLQEIPGFNGCRRGEELSFKFLVSLFLLLCKVPQFILSMDEIGHM